MDLPNEARLRWILRTTSALLERGAEPVRGLIEPTPEFFPERPDGTPRPLPALLARAMEHAGLGDVAVEVSIAVPDEESLAGGCSSGACGPEKAPSAESRALLTRRSGGYSVVLPLALAGSPPLLGAHLARVASAIFLHEADAFGGLDRREADAAVEISATLLGFGVLIANGSHVVSKGCGGVRIARGTVLPVEEAGVALATFATLFEIDPRHARRHLEITPKEAFDEGAAWCRANADVVRMLRDSPRAIEGDAYRLRPAHGWLARTFGLGRRKPPVDVLSASDDELVRELGRTDGRPTTAKPRDPAREARLQRARAIVDETLAKS